MILTNPFSIAKRFSMIINSIGNRVSKILKDQGKSDEDIEIDFDQLFSLLLTCIFASGLSEITLPMNYAYRFGEFMTNDYDLQFAASHMEGICMHIKNLDFDEIQRKSNALLEEFKKNHPET